MHRSQVGVLTAVCVLLGASLAHAASLPYPGPIVVQDGSYSNIVESSITDPPPLFGPPAAGAGNTLTFTMSAFTASASDDSADNTAGALDLTFDADPGTFIGSVSIFESGSFAVTGNGSVSIAGALTLRYLNEATQQIVTLGEPIHAVTTPLGSFPVAGTRSGNWVGVALIDLDALGIQTRQVIISMDNNLIASAPLGGTATISKDELTVNVTPIPEPASLALIAAGSLMIAWRRK
jgi:PEP-CTERM motif-containing protein